MKKAQKEGIYVILIDNPANFAADAFVGSDWTGSGRSRPKPWSRAAARNPRRRSAWCRATRPTPPASYQYAGIMKVLEKHPDFQVVAKPDFNWDATTSRNVTTTMLQQNPDICGIIDFWDGDATGAAAAIRDAGKQDQIYPGDHRRRRRNHRPASCWNGTFGAVVLTELVNESQAMNAMIKFLLQSGQPAGHRRRPTSTR